MTAITHIRLAVPDLDAAIQWYEQVLVFNLLV
ncbi:catechol 2,3-dioxygenase-like lactoylglutathione lyase family enzyme [Peribacillus simplex]|nr:VOC family protein [Peribacillus simplex]MDF9760392.1 catechol 2,3-dioxygenase-like lactoylglutathione lyase family enzyme [Peribacillus simplex]